MSMQSLMSMQTALRQATVQGNARSHNKGKINVLKSEMKLDGGGSGISSLSGIMGGTARMQARSIRRFNRYGLPASPILFLPAPAASPGLRAQALHTARSCGS